MTILLCIFVKFLRTMYVEEEVFICGKSYEFSFKN